MMKFFKLSALIWLVSFALASPAFAGKTSCGLVLNTLDADKTHEIQEAASENGVAVVIEGDEFKSEKDRVEAEKLHGVPVKVISSSSRRPQKTKGVVIHLGKPENAGKELDGSINLTESKTAVFKKLFNNKWEEYKFAVKYDRNAMPKSINSSSFLPRESTERALMAIQDFLSGSRTRVNKEQISAVQDFMEEFFVLSKLKFSNGAFIKLADEYQSGDKFGLITTFGTRPEDLVREFTRALQQLKSKKKKADIDELLTSEKKAVRLLALLMKKPKRVFIQEKLDLQLVGGKPLEIRVDFASGVVFNATVRYGDAVLPLHKEQALQFVADFLNKLPPEIRGLSGGADVVFTTDGEPKFIEFNFGAESGFIDAEMDPIAANYFIAGVKGEPTYLLLQLESIYYATERVQIDFLKHLPAREAEVRKSVDELSVMEAFRWLRDRMIEEWLENPTEQGADTISEHLHTLVKGQRKSTQELLAPIEAAARDYFKGYEAGLRL